MLKSNARYIITAVLAAAAIFTAPGCGGGGGGSSTSSSPTNNKGNITVRLSLPRTALQSSYSYNADIFVYTVDSTGAKTLVTSSSTPLVYVYDATSSAFIGYFALKDIPAGDNYLVKIDLTYTMGVARAAAQTSYTLGHFGALVDVSDGLWSTALVTSESSIAALAQMRLAMTSSPAVDLSAISQTADDSLESYLYGGTADTFISSFMSTYLMSTTDPFNVSNWSTAMTSDLDGVLASANVIDKAAPTVSSFSPATGATGVAHDGTAFKVVFSEAMDTTVDLNTQSTLTASGFSITLQRQDTGGTLTIDSTNALSYGTFAWGTTTTTNDTLTFTLKASATLVANGLKKLYPGITYNITTRTVPTNLKDVAGNALSSTGIASTGSFTTTGDSTSPTVTSFSPATGATNVAADAPSFKVVFSETMATTVDLNNANTLFSSGFSITLQRQDTGNTLTLNYSNALNYGTFSWGTTTNTSDTLIYTLKSTATLTANGLSHLTAGKTYNITSRTVPTNLTDAAGNALSATGIASTGSFTTVADATPPTVSSLSPSNGQTGVSSDGTVFKVIFSESMDSTIDLNNYNILVQSGFSITLQRQDTGNYLLLDANNVLSYGTFSWTTTTYTNDTLNFTLYSSSTLTSLGLKTLTSGKTYNITNRAIPSNLKDAAGNALTTTGVATTGSFTTL